MYRRNFHERCVEAIGKGTHVKIVAIVPCWRKPEFLYHCLKHLTASNVDAIWVFQDYGKLGPPYGKENAEVVSHFPNVQVASYEKNHGCFGVTKLLVHALKVMLNETSLTHFLICEEDVLMSPNWVEFHANIHQNNPWCCLSVGKTLEFNAIGASFSRRVVEDLIKFPFSDDRQFDGTVRDYTASSNVRILKTEISCAWHIGWWGYNTGNHDLRPVGSLRERVNHVHDFILGASNVPRVEVAEKPIDWIGVGYDKL